MIALHRPGAIGDVLMTCNLIPALKDKHLGEEIVYYCAAGIGDALRSIMLAAGVSEVRDCANFDRDIRDSARDSARDPALNPMHSFNLIGYPLHEGYPEKPMRQHLIRYFAAELGIECPDELPSLHLALPESHIECPDELPRYATIQVKAGWSHYKDWPIERWNETTKRLRYIKFVQIGLPGDPLVIGADHMFIGESLETAISLIANARLHVGIDSFSNHVTHYTWEGKGQTPAVILWGSTQASAAGYPHNTNISLGLPCQPCFREDPTLSHRPRGPCINPPGQLYGAPRHACMAGITVEQVVDAIREKWQ